RSVPVVAPIRPLPLSVLIFRTRSHNGPMVYAEISANETVAAGRRSCQARVIGRGYKGTGSDCAPLPESCVRCSRDARRLLGPRQACRAKVVPSRSAVRPQL